MKEYICYWIYRSSLPAEECRQFSFKKYCDLMNLNYEQAVLKAKRNFSLLVLVFALIFVLAF